MILELIVRREDDDLRLELDAGLAEDGVAHMHHEVVHLVRGRPADVHDKARVLLAHLRAAVAVALQLLRDLVQTLVLLDKEGIHHGDINPANVILCNSGTHLQAVLIDCGIVGPGALGYAAPERFQGQPASAKSDLYSLGMLLFRWVAGQNLLDSQDYNEFASQAFAIDTMDVSSRLYEIDCCSAEELSALSALWKVLLRSDPETRVEDFDELEEITKSKPVFSKISYNLKLKGDIIPVSNALKNDADVDVIAEIGDIFAKKSVNTENGDILTLLAEKVASAVTGDGVSAINSVLNVTLDVAFLQKM